MKLWSFYGGLMLFIALWFVLFKPYEIGKKKATPTTILIEKFHYEELGLKGKKLDLFGSKGVYDQKILRIEKLLARDPDKNESIRANVGIYDKVLLKLRGNVHYRSPQYRFTSQKANYYKKLEKLVVPVKFWLYSKEFNATGSSLVYYKRSGRIEASQIDAKVMFR